MKGADPTLPAALDRVTTPRALEAVTERVSQNPAAVYLARLAPGSRRTMRTALVAIVAIALGAASVSREALASFPWHELRYQHTQAIRTVLAERYAPATANRHLAALRGVLKEAWRLGLMRVDDYRRAADVEPVRGERLPAGREISRGELHALFDACARDAGPAGLRDAALLAILYGGGLRRAEAVSLDVSDFDDESGRLTVRSGKGRKARTVYATNGSRAALRAWLALRTCDVGEPLLCPVNRGGRITVRRMTDQAVREIVRKRAREAGITQTLSPHDFRRSFVGHLLDSGADIATVQKLAGHANPATTARYDRRGEEAKKRASELLHVPFTAGGREAGGVAGPSQASPPGAGRGSPPDG